MLETNRCYLRKIQEDDFNDIKLLYINEDVREYLGGTRDEDAIKVGFAEILNSTTESLYLIAKNKQTNDFIGVISLDTHHDGVSTEVSYQLLPKWWGQGYATEILQEVINFAFTELNLPELVAETQSANQASCRLLEKLGMCKREIVMRFGAEQIIYALSDGGN